MKNIKKLPQAHKKGKEKMTVEKTDERKEIS